MTGASLHLPAVENSLRLRFAGRRLTAMNAVGNFRGQKAPCGRIVDGENFDDQDDEVIVTQETVYTCGCQSIQHQYHDGSVSRRVVRHDGRVIVDELLSAE